MARMVKGTARLWQCSVDSSRNPMLLLDRGASDRLGAIFAFVAEATGARRCDRGCMTYCTSSTVSGRDGTMLARVDGCEIMAIAGG